MYKYLDKEYAALAYSELFAFSNKCTKNLSINLKSDFLTFQTVFPI